MRLTLSIGRFRERRTGAGHNVDAGFLHVPINLTPVASMHLRAASANSGPVPSPIINVTSCAMMILSVLYSRRARSQEISQSTEINRCPAERQRAGIAVILIPRHACENER